MPSNHPPKANPLTLWAFLSLSLFAALPVSAAPPSIAFVEGTVEISGISRGGQAIWFSVGRSARNFGVTVRQLGGVENDTDSDGIVRIELDEVLAPASVWAAIDSETGWVALARADGSPVDPTVIHGNPRNALRKIDFEDRDLLYVLVARAKIGAWMARVGDGGPDDEDREPNRQIELPLSSMAPLGASPPPLDRLERDDVVLAIDPRSLNVFAAGVRD